MTSNADLADRHPIAVEIQSWLDWQERCRRKEGLPVTDDTHLIVLPYWPTRGTLKNWIAEIERLTALRSEPAAGDVERVARAIHDALGNGWAYQNYGGDEWNDLRADLMKAARAALAAMAGETGGE